jgi:hypothetical protein
LHSSTVLSALAMAPRVLSICTLLLRLYSIDGPAKQRGFCSSPKKKQAAKIPNRSAGTAKKVPLVLCGDIGSYRSFTGGTLKA